jgi:hypothetical protein
VALTADCLLTVDEVENELGLTPGADTRIEGWIKDASAMIATFLKRTLQTATITAEKHHANGGNYLVLRRAPITSITSITIDGDTVSTDDYVIDDADAGTVFFENGLADLGLIEEGVSRSRAHGTGERVYSVTYVGGWTTAGQGVSTVPRDVVRAAMATVVALRSSAARDPAVKSEAMPGYSVTYGDVDASGLPPVARALLEPFRFVE